MNKTADIETERDSANDYILNTHLLSLSLLQEPSLMVVIKKVYPHIKFLCDLIEQSEENTMNV